MSVLKEAEDAMKGALEATRREFATVRTGKATPALLDTVRVSAYGTQLPLQQVATVHAPEPNLLLVQPFDPSLIGAVEKAIRTADLGFNPSNDGKVIRVPVPPLNEERRKEYVRLLHKLAEEGRISVRQARHRARETIQKQMKDHELGEDDGERLLKDLDRLTHAYTDKIDEALKRKEEEVMTL